MSQGEAESVPDEAPGPPRTGLPAVDEALGTLTDLDERTVAEHHDALAAAHEALHGALHSSSDATPGH